MRLVQLDPPTLEFVAFLFSGLTAGAYITTWVENRRETAPLWMAGATGLAAAGLLSQDMIPSQFTTAATGCTLLLALGLVTTACRRLRGGRPHYGQAMLAAALWLCVSLVPRTVDPILRVHPFMEAFGCTLALMQIVLAVRELSPVYRGKPRLWRWLNNALAAQAIALAWWVDHILLGKPIFAGSNPAKTYLEVLSLDLICLMMVLLFGVISLLNERSTSRYRKAANRDHLTGIGNRRYFEQCLDEKIAAATQDGLRPLSLIMLDADQFKSYNDSAGHTAGDDCLRSLAAAVSSACRPTDVVARYGGEEFAVVLPDTNASDAFAIAERIRHRVRLLALPHPDPVQSIVTISLGTATLNPQQGRMTAEELVAAADGALYAAKRAGRDRTHAATPRESAAATPAQPQPAPPIALMQ